MKTIDINCDLGEGSGNDAALMPYISSCSIACGGHAGNKATMLKSIHNAQDLGVKTGAHPAYPDPENFGRISMKITLKKLQDALRSQLDLFYTLCADVNHIKPHGALYNDMYDDYEKAAAFVEVSKEYASNPKVFCSPNSALATVAQEEGMIVVYEGFGDRAYTPTGKLASRSHPKALLTDKDQVAKQVLSIVSDKKIITLEGQPIPLNVQTLCMHGDGKNVVENLKHLNQVLKKNAIHVVSV